VLAVLGLAQVFGVFRASGIGVLTGFVGLFLDFVILYYLLYDDVTVGAFQ
jgi:hypothetical protein